MPENKKKAPKYDSLEYAIFYHATQIICAVLGVTMLYKAYDQACESNLLPREWCKWSTSQPVQPEAIPTPLPPIRY